MMSSFVRAVTLFGTAIALFGCGRPFDTNTPSDFVELQARNPTYDYRATTPEGVVVAVRALDMEGAGNLSFWERAVTLRMRDVAGYALVQNKDVRSDDGTPGRQLRFGHDQDGKPYSYWVTLFIAQGRLLMLEAGGRSEKMVRYEPKLDWQVATFRARCGSLVTPVLASRTCNRW